MPRRRASAGLASPSAQPAGSRRRCAIYTRKSSEEGLDQDFNSLAAQREACEAYIRSQAHEGWQAIPTRFDDGGFSGGTLERPALQELLSAIKARRVDIVVIYKIDRLSRSLMDFAQLAEVFDAHQVSFVSVTQSFNTTTSMGRLMLNVLLSFAQFEREITGERIRDKIAASKKKGLWMGGNVPFGYRAQGRTLVPYEAEAETVRTLYRLYLTHGTVRIVHWEATRLGLTTRRREWADGRVTGGKAFCRGHLYRVLNNPLYVGRIPHKGQSYPGGHAGLVDTVTWDAVQAGLAAKTQRQRRGGNAHHASLLTGLLVNPQGRALRVTQAVKKGRTYRYYSDRNVICGDTVDPDIVRHVRAEDVDRAVLEALDRFLRNHRVPGRKPVAATGSTDPTRPEPERRSIAKALLKRVVLHPDRLQLTLDLGRLPSPARPDRPVRSRPDEHEIVVPAAWRRRQGIYRLIFDDGEKATPPRVDVTLVQALARAQRWWRQLEQGQYSSVQALAAAERLSGSFVTRVIRMALLSPTLVKTMVRGLHPSEVSARRLINGPSFPAEWASQEQEFARRYGD